MWTAERGDVLRRCLRTEWRCDAVVRCYSWQSCMCHTLISCYSLKIVWRFGLVGNVVGRINEVNQRRARLVLGWVTVFKTGKPSLYVTSHPCQLSLAIPPRVGKLSTGDDYGHRQRRNGEFCVTVGPVPGLLAYWPSPLSGRLGLYASLIGFNRRRLKVLKSGWAPTQRT